MGVWQGQAMNSLMFRPGPPCPILVRPFGHPTPYAYVVLSQNEATSTFHGGGGVFEVETIVTVEDS
jgi:hypothetical protein